MNEKTIKIITIILNLIAFVVAVSLVYHGRLMTGYVGLGIMSIGAVILLIQLYLYNRKFK